jgi:glutamine amidotransferase
MKVIVVDYGRGNLFSLSLALKYVGVEHEVSSEPRMVRSASILILPGVGAFADAVTGLKDRGLFEPVRHHAMDDKPFLGICVGCQLLMSVGEEFGVTEGLDILPGNVRRISNLLPAETNGPMRIPNVGWRAVTPEHNGKDGIWAANLPEDPMYYFVHSFIPTPENAEHVHARSDFNGIAIPVAVKKGNVLGVQFHPERSGDTGLNLLESVIGGWR